MLERRYRVLQLIFEDKQHSQLQTLSIEEVAARIGASRGSIWDDVNYLRDKGLIVINERQIGTRVYFTFDITSAGIDAAEGLTALAHYQRPADGAESTLPIPPRIFLSHSHHDVMFCRRLALFIRQHIPTADVFYDESQLMAGDDWVQLIPRQVVDRPIFIVVLSPYSVEANWVREETQIALREAMNNPGRSVIPVLCQDCDIDRLSPF